MEFCVTGVKVVLRHRCLLVTGDPRDREGLHNFHLKIRDKRARCDCASVENIGSRVVAVCERMMEEGC